MKNFDHVFITDLIQPEAQPSLTHEDMNADYPRFGSISDIHLTSSEKEMLMVKLFFLSLFFMQWMSSLLV